MFDMSWGEIMVIGGVALIVIGPKDLPKALRTVGQMTAKVRKLAGEFQSQFSEAMREAELDEVRREVEGLNRSVASATSGAFNPIQTIRDELKTSIDRPPEPVPPEYTPLVEPPLPPEHAGPLVEETGPVPHVEQASASETPHQGAADAMPFEPAGPGMEQLEDGRLPEARRAGPGVAA
jgi:sec-independent protein translocase protein TatB